MTQYAWCKICHMTCWMYHVISKISHMILQASFIILTECVSVSLVGAGIVWCMYLLAYVRTYVHVRACVCVCA